MNKRLIALGIILACAGFGNVQSMNFHNRNDSFGSIANRADTIMDMVYSPADQAVREALNAGTVDATIIKREVQMMVEAQEAQGKRLRSEEKQDITTKLLADYQAREQAKEDNNNLQ